MIVDRVVYMRILIIITPVGSSWTYHKEKVALQFYMPHDRLQARAYRPSRSICQEIDIVRSFSRFQVGFSHFL